VANSYVTFTTNADTALTEYVIPFAFFKKEDVKVKSVRQNGTILSWTYLEEAYFTANQANLAFGNYCVVFENGQNKIKFIQATITYYVTIFRRTSDTLIRFSNGSTLQADDLNKLALLNIYTTEESFDASVINTFDSQLFTKFDKSGGTISGSTDVQGVLSATNMQTPGTLSVTNNNGNGLLYANRISMVGGTIIGVPVPVNATDVANKSYVDTAVSAGNGGNGGNGGTFTIEDDSITDAKLRKVAGQQAVTTSTIRDGAIVATKLFAGGDLSGPVITNTIRGSAVTATKLATDSVITSKIQNGAVIADKLATDSVTTSKIQNGAVTADKIAVNTFTGASIADNTVSVTKLKEFPISYNEQIINPTKKDVTINGNVILSVTPTPVNSYQTQTAINTVGNIRCNQVYEKTIPDDQQAYSLQYNQDFLYKQGELKISVAGDSRQFTHESLDKYDEQPLVFKKGSLANGYSSFQIVVKPKDLSIGAVTLAHLGRFGILNSGQGSAQTSFANSEIIKNTISNIRFNKMSANDNPIGLDINTGVFSFLLSQRYTTKYKITLTGHLYAPVAGNMTIRPISDGIGSYAPPPYSQPANLQTLQSTAETGKIKTHFFSVTSILTLPFSGDAVTTWYLPVQYYFRTSSTSTLSRWGHEFVNTWHSPGVSSALPEAWQSSAGSPSAVVANDHAVQICIEKVASTPFESF